MAIAFGSADGFTATVIAIAPLRHWLRTHVLALDAGHHHGLLHGVAAERLAQLLIENDLDEGRDALLLIFARLAQGLGQFGLRFHYDTLEPAGFSHFCIAQMRIELGADEVVVIPEDGVALFSAPLVVAENHHRDARPFLAADRAHLVHGNPERAVAGKTYARRIGVADLGADDRGKAVAARPKQAGGQIFPAFIEGRIGVADGAVVADVAGNDRILRQAGLDRAPRLARRHSVRVALTRVGIPCGAGIVVL